MLDHIVRRMKRDSKEVNSKKVWYCQGKTLLGDDRCDRVNGVEVNLKIHHLIPFTFASLYSKLGENDVLPWHANPDNLKYLISLCEICHETIHAKEADGEVA